MWESCLNSRYNRGVARITDLGGDGHGDCGPRDDVKGEEGGPQKPRVSRGTSDREFARVYVPGLVFGRKREQNGTERVH